MHSAVPSLIELLHLKKVTPKSERETWLGWLETYILYKLDALDDVEKEFVAAKMNIDSFFQAQSEEVRYAINTCIAAEGEGLEQLLATLAEAELA